MERQEGVPVVPMSSAMGSGVSEQGDERDSRCVCEMSWSESVAAESMIGALGAVGDE